MQWQQPSSQPKKTILLCPTVALIPSLPCPAPLSYNNIYVAELGALLGVPADKAEAAAGRMVMENRLQVGPGAFSV